MTAYAEPLITAACRLPTRHGVFDMESFRFGDDALPHFALYLGQNDSRTPLVRLHSECVTGEVFGSLRCDCGEQLDEALRRIREAGRGILIYLRQEGRGIGIENKLRAYALQDGGLDTVDANLALGLPVDARGYGAAVAYLRHRRVRACTLLTNNSDKARALEAAGIQVERTPLRVPARDESLSYLNAKRLRLGQDC